MVTLSDRGEIYADRPDPIVSPDVQEWIAANRSELLDMNTGHPRKAVGREVKEAIEKTLKRQMDYSAPSGSEPAKEAVARYGDYMMGILDRTSESHYEPNDVVITANGTDAFSILIDATAQEGNTVLLSPPFYSAYIRPIRASGAEIVQVSADAENGFNPTFEQLTQAWEDNKDTATLMFIPTGNPTGAPFNEKQAQEIAKAIEYINEKSGGAVTFTLDVVYQDLSKGEDQPIYPLLSDAARENTVQIISGSKILSFTSSAGAVLTKNDRLRDAAEGAREMRALSAPILGQAGLAAGLNKIVDDQIKWKEDKAAGKSSPFAQGIEANAREYLTQMRYVERGLKAIERSYGLTGDEGGKLFAYKPEKALYVFPNMSKLFKGREVPDIKVFGDVSLREFVGSDTIQNDQHVENLLVAMAGREPGAKGVVGRPGRVFGMPTDDCYMRFTCTQQAKGEERPRDGLKIPQKHRDFLEVVDDAMQLLGAERKRPLEINENLTRAV